MRTVGQGQQVTLIVIPEVAQLMRRQLVKAGAPPPEQSLVQTLRSVSAWLVINSMRTERVQFDQLCGQNLANIWRQNAWNLLLAEHQRFKVRPEATQGFALELLADRANSTLKFNAPKRAAQLRDLITELGPTFIKAGLFREKIFRVFLWIVASATFSLYFP